MSEYPKTFRHLLELTLSDVERPTHVWLAYAVCAVDRGSCGWGGWLIDGVFATREDSHSEVLQAVMTQICPACGKSLFRTEVQLRFDVSAHQTSVHGATSLSYSTPQVTKMKDKVAK